jgi:hypothetical protein
VQLPEQIPVTCVLLYLVDAEAGCFVSRLSRVRPALCSFATESRARLKAPALGSAASVIAVPGTQATPRRMLSREQIMGIVAGESSDSSFENALHIVR